MIGLFFLVSNPYRPLLPSTVTGFNLDNPTLCVTGWPSNYLTVIAGVAMYCNRVASMLIGTPAPTIPYLTQMVGGWYLGLHLTIHLTNHFTALKRVARAPVLSRNHFGLYAVHVWLPSMDRLKSS